MEAIRERKEWLNNVKNHWFELAQAPEHIKNDREIVMAAVLQDAYAMQYAAWDLSNDPELAEVALQQGYDAHGNRLDGMC